MRSVQSSEPISRFRGRGRTPLRVVSGDRLRHMGGRPIWLERFPIFVAVAWTSIESKHSKLFVYAHIHDFCCLFSVSGPACRDPRRSRPTLAESGRVGPPGSYPEDAESPPGAARGRRDTPPEMCRGFEARGGAALRVVSGDRLRHMGRSANLAGLSVSRCPWRSCGKASKASTAN